MFFWRCCDAILPGLWGKIPRRGSFLCSLWTSTATSCRGSDECKWSTHLTGDAYATSRDSYFTEPALTGCPIERWKGEGGGRGRKATRHASCCATRTSGDGKRPIGPGHTAS